MSQQLIYFCAAPCVERCETELLLLFLLNCLVNKATVIRSFRLHVG